MKMGSARFVEFIGLPGAGKSTVLEEIIRSNGAEKGLRDWKGRKYSSFGKLTLWVATIFICPGLLKDVFSYAFLIGRPSLFLARLVFSYLTLSREMKMTPDAGGLALQDQGLCQILAAMSVPVKDQREFSLSKKMVSDIEESLCGIVYFKIDESSAIERVLSRRSWHSRFDREEFHDAKSELACFNRTLSQLIEGLRSDSRIAVLEVNAADKVESIASVIEEWVSTLHLQAGRREDEN